MVLCIRVAGGGVRARGAGVGERVLRVRVRGVARAGAGAAPGRARAPRRRRAPRRAAPQDTQQRRELLMLQLIDQLSLLQFNARHGPLSKCTTTTTQHECPGNIV